MPELSLIPARPFPRRGHRSLLWRPLVRRPLLKVHESRAFQDGRRAAVIGCRSDLEPFLGILENHFDLARDLLAFVVRTMLNLPERSSA